MSSTSIDEPLAESQGSGINQVTEAANQAEEEEREVSNEPKFAPPRLDRGSGRRIPFLPNTGGGSGRRRGVDYAQYYPPDELGAQTGPNARVWRVYLDEADEYDAEMMESFRDTTDVLLVFAGLFSAVVTTFLSQAAQALQPDYAQVTASLMTELVSLQRAMATGASVAEIGPSQLSFSNADTTTSLDHWVNGLWFTSLSLSLVAALLAVLVKQWLQYYISALSGTPRDRVRIRHFRFMGLQTWKVSEIIDTLPVLLHMSLFMFMAGLVIFVWSLDRTIAFVILGITTTCFLIYSLSHILAFLYPSCSYKTPIAEVVSYVWAPLRSLATFRLRRHNPSWDHSYGKSFQLFGQRFLVSSPRLVFSTSKQREEWASYEDIDKVLILAIEWLHSASANPSASTMSMEYAAGLPLHLEQKYTSHTENPVYHELVSISEPQKAGQDLWVPLMAYCAIDRSPWIPERFHIPYTTLRPSAPVTIQCLAAFLYTDGSGPDSGLVSKMIFDRSLLPPWMWKLLFEKGTWNHTSDPLKLLFVLLDVMRETGITSLLPTIAKNKRANWNLPPTIGLVELCTQERRMAIPIFQFACRQLLSGPSADCIQRQLDAMNDANQEETNDTTPVLVHFVHGILDQFQVRLEVTGNIPVHDYLSNVERALFSVHVDHWLMPIFLDALHRCIVLRTSTADSDHDIPPRLYYRQPVATSTTLVMLYLLDVLQHPWPISRVSDFEWSYPFIRLCSQIFSKQETKVFEAFICHDGIASFRRRVPLQFKASDTIPQLCTIFIPYVEFVAKLDDKERQSHLAIISEPQNLAWFMWLSLSPGGHYPFQGMDSQTARNRMCQLLRSLPIERGKWLDAVEVLVEELRKDSALFDLDDLFYPDVKQGLEALGLGSDFRLYGYTSPAVTHLFEDFSIVDEDGSSSDSEPMFGPFAVYYSPNTSHATHVTSLRELNLLVQSVKDQIKQIQAANRRVQQQPLMILNDLERGGTVTS